MSHHIAEDDYPWVLQLNQANVTELAPLDRDQLALLIGKAYFARAAEGGAFGIALDHTADHDGFNFQWFKTRFDKFVYVDRVAVAATHRQRGLARQLYTDLFAAARADGHDKVVCEINQEPPNPGSVAFHTRMGFTKIGESPLPDSAKTVGYYLCSLTPNP